MKSTVKLEPPATIVVAGYRTLSGVRMGTLIVRVTDVQDFLHDMLLPAMNTRGLGYHLFPRGTVALIGVNTVITKISYLNVGHFKMPLRKDTDCPTTDYLDLELAPRGNRQTKAAFPTRVLSGNTIPTGSALASRRRRSGAMEVVATLVIVPWLFIATSAVAPGLLLLWTTVSAHGVCLIRGEAMGEALAFTTTTSFAAPTTLAGLSTATAISYTGDSCNCYGSEG